MFKAGQSGNPAGRKAGHTNKVTVHVREAISNQLDSYFISGDFEKDIDALTPRDRIKAFADLIGYVVPKLQATTIDNHTAAKADFAEEIRKLVEGN